MGGEVEFGTHRKLQRALKGKENTHCGELSSVYWKHSVKTRPHLIESTAL